MNPFEFYRAFAKLTPDKLRELAGVAILTNDDEVISKIKNQLWDGKTGFGEDITPSYLDDPYFSSREKAENYAKWKNKITDNTNRNIYAPNLYINGKFYSELFINSSFNVDAGSFGKPIISKYGDSTFVLDVERSENSEVIKNIKTKFIEQIKNILT